MRNPNGEIHAFGGIFREISPPARLIMTFCYEPMPDVEAVETIDFIDDHGRTIVETTTVHRTVAHRDGHVGSGMVPGATETMNRLEEYLRTMQ